MEIQTTDLASLFEKALKNLPEDNVEEIGIVIKVSDNICKIHGLTHVLLNELVLFEGGNKGIVFQLDEDSVAVFLFFNIIPVRELEIVKRTGSLFEIGLTKNLLGRVINAIGTPIDGLEPLEYEEFRSIETTIPGIIERSPVNESLETGILAIDALIPIGKGQRELLIGNRGTGKTSIAIDTILHQKDKKVICIYVAVGLRQANVAHTINLLETRGALPYTIIINAQAGDAVLNQYIAPYVGCTIAEYFRDQGKDVLIVYDDLSNHAIAFREMSLLLRRAPGREAYPGDVFYFHSRLLERAGKLKAGGSITALPIVQIQGDDITSYIPTNLISITDGQIFLNTQLFNQGVFPAVDTELSVSRVGRSAQTNAIKKMTKALKLELAQYHDLAAFAQFGTELDEISRRQLSRGKIIIELLKQAEHTTYSFVESTLQLFLLKENFLDSLLPKNVSEFSLQFISYVQSVYKTVYDTIHQTADISPETHKKLIEIAQEFTKLFVSDNN